MSNAFGGRCRSARASLLDAQRNLQKAQAEVLADCIGQGIHSAFGLEHGFSNAWTPNRFRAAVPIRDYSSLEPWISRVTKGEFGVLTSEEPTAFLKTSGTTGKNKSIPSTDHWRLKYRAPGIYAQWDTYAEHAPDIFEPDTTLDLTWDRRIPTHFLAGKPFHPITHRSTAISNEDWVPPWFEAPWFNLETETEDFDCRLYTRVRYFLDKPLHTIVTINPSMLVLLATRLDEKSDYFIKDVRDGTVNGESSTRFKVRANLHLSRKLEQIRNDHGMLTPAAIWPELRLLACWRSGGAVLYNDILEELFPKAKALPFMTCGTEGIVTIPVDDHSSASPLAANQAFYEFADEIETPLGETKRDTLLAHELEVGKDYQLIMTQANGMYRYAVGDIYRVLEKDRFDCPRLEFLRRAGVVFSFTGEKLTESDVITAFLGTLADEQGAMSTRSATAAGGFQAERASAKTGLFTVVPIFATLPYYAFFTELPLEASTLGHLADVLDRRLRDLNEEYHSKRVSSRLGGVKLITLMPGTFSVLRKAVAAASDIQVKHVVVHRSGAALSVLTTRSLHWSDAVARDELLNPGTAPTLRRATTVPPRPPY